MRRSLPIFVSLVLFSLSFTSCLYMEEVESEVTASEVEQAIDAVELSDEGNFSILSAKEFFDGNVNGFGLLDLAGDGHSTDVETRSAVGRRVLTPAWAKGRRYEQGGLLVVDVPVSSVDKIWARRKYFGEDGLQHTMKTLALTKLMFIVDPVKQDTTVRIATIVPDYAYTRAGKYTISAVHSIPTNQNFTGHVFYSDLEGNFTAGYVYTNGERTHWIFRDPFHEEAHHEEMHHEHCADHTHHHGHHLEYPHRIPDHSMYEHLTITIAEDVIYTRSSDDNCAEEEEEEEEEEDDEEDEDGEEQDENYYWCDICGAVPANHDPRICGSGGIVKARCEICGVALDENKNCPAPKCARCGGHNGQHSRTCASSGSSLGGSGGTGLVVIPGGDTGGGDNSGGGGGSSGGGIVIPPIVGPGTGTGNNPPPIVPLVPYQYSPRITIIADPKDLEKIIQILDRIAEDCMGKVLAASINENLTITDEEPEIEGAAATYNHSQGKIKVGKSADNPNGYMDYVLLEEATHHADRQNNRNPHTANMEVTGKTAVYRYMKRDEDQYGNDRTSLLPQTPLNPWNYIRDFSNDPSNYDRALTGIANMGYMDYVNEYEENRAQYQQYENLDFLDALEAQEGCN